MRYWQVRVSVRALALVFASVFGLRVIPFGRAIL